MGAAVRESRRVDYRLAPALAARLLGVGLVLLALLVLLATCVVVLAAWPQRLLLLVGAFGLAALASAAWVLRRRVLVSLTEVGYRVSLVRGAGVSAARWADVEDAVAQTRLGERCVLIRLRDGRSTTIPTSAIAGDPEDFARDVRRFLRDFSGR